MIAERILDVILALVLLVYLGEGWRNGILRSVSVIVGIAAGGIAAYFAVPVIAAAIPSPDLRLGAAVAASLLLLAGGHLIGATVASRLQRRSDDPRRERDPGTAARIFGALANLTAAALVTTLVAGSVAQMGVPVLSQAVARSAVIRAIESVTPAPVDEALGRVRAAIFETGIPTIDRALGGVTTAPAPPVIDTATDPLDAAAASVARISGVAFACGQNQTGSGFVIAPERVVTNAHVVAGVTRPVVTLPDGQVVDGQIVLFDAGADVAVIAAPGLTARPLPLDDAQVGDRGVVDGYPHGGGFTSVPAEVLAISQERVADIHGGSVHLREVLTLAAEVVPGNSGGPLVALDGDVTGLIFARAATAERVGYALSSAQLAQIVADARSLTAPVSSGACVAG
ncbi:MULTISPECIES: MarP family serine protease [unclassified Salinibacterium]|uniref:MarP family serine protease n=1 Tax=unclassified Salinibacterium TaxID=2632331 RepID=UPI0014236CFF|nr:MULTISPECIES: MarP family serine protease [unclassified Salinibacterium]